MVQLGLVESLDAVKRSAAEAAHNLAHTQEKMKVRVGKREKERHYLYAIPHCGQHK